MHDTLAQPLVELARGAHRVEHRVALRAPDQVRVVARRPEPFVIGLHDRVARLQPAREHRGRRPEPREGAHWSAMPVVPWAHEMTGQPPFGALPFGIDTVPDTATPLPLTPTER